MRRCSVIERGEHLCFAREPRQPIGIECKPLGQHLQGDIAIEFPYRERDTPPHGARTERRHDLIGANADTCGEDPARRGVVRRRQLGSERIVEHRPMGCG